MKRKIAAILAADIVGYSRLVAEDEEEALRRLASYRAVFDDFIARGSGRIFNTAGDAVLAEFPSAVEAVRCAIDVQESLRTRNLAYPSSRHMTFRMGITIGDVVERDGDLLGDGVNIAARLEGLAPVGGICVSRTVYEQVANKLSVQFADIGEQQVKNIPTPIHAFTLTLGPQEGGTNVLTPRSKPTTMGMWPIAVTAASFAAACIAALFYFVIARTSQSVATNATQTTPAVADAQKSSPPAVQKAEVLVPEAVPFITDRDRGAIRSEYMSAPDHKALAISRSRIGFITGQGDDETAKAAALASCQRTSDAVGPGRKCELYAVGNLVVSTRGHPPMPPEPWLVRDQAIERPFTGKDVPLINDHERALLDASYPAAHGRKALALSPRGFTTWYSGDSDEVIRRSLEWCGSNSGVPCMIIAMDGAFVVPIPITMKVVGFFRASNNGAIAPEARDDVANRVGNSTSGWNAVAVGASGRPGLMLKTANEQNAVDGALADCSRQDRGCHVIAIGPFAVELR